VNRALPDWLGVAKLDEKPEKSRRFTFSQLRNKLNEFYQQSPLCPLPRRQYQWHLPAGARRLQLLSLSADGV
jgi:hypothetical protein